MRLPLLGLLLAAAFSLGGGGGVPAAGGDAARCADLTGDAARACYTREVAASLGASRAAAPTFATTSFVCELHTRTGVWR